MNRTPRVLAFVSAVILVSAAASVYAQTTVEPKMAPMNPEFVEYLRARTFSRAMQITADGHALGLIPLPVLPSNVRPPAGGLDRIDSLPLSFDLRDIANKLPEVRDQSSCGSCWAFGTYGTLESYLRPTEAFDFSEQNLIDHSGFALGRCDGGNIYMSTAYLTRWTGPVDEADDPYNPGSASPGSTIPPARKHVQGTIFLPMRASALDNDLLKSFVGDAWVVYVSMMWVNSGYNATHSSFYNNGVTTEPGGGGHAVCIVGWDDNYPASNFNVAPPGNGAFIVRNSWGPSWGEAGYFYVSYYDTLFARRDVSAMILAEDTAKYSGVFQYDPLGWCADMGYGPGFETAWAANVFTAPAKTSIAAAGFYAVSANCSYEVRVYTGATGTNPRAGTLKATTAGTCVFAGYTTVPLSSPVPVAAGQKFSIVVRFTTPGYNYPVATEIRSAGYSDGAVAHTGESLLSLNGSTWTDFMLNASYVPRQINFCIKAYTAPVPAITVTDPASGARWIRGTTQTINWTKSGTQAAMVKIQLFRDTTKVSDITLSTGNDGTFDWAIPANLTARTGYAIRVTTTDGKVKGTSAKFTITKPTLTVTAPAASAIWTRGTTRAILWTKNGPQNDLVRIQLIRYGVLIAEISPSTANSGTFDWAIPANTPKGAGFKIRVKTLDNLVKDDSGLFTLK
jgi:C1A family cysteine protease